MSKQRLFLHQTRPECARKVLTVSPTAAHNPEVAGSNPVPATMASVLIAFERL